MRDLTERMTFLRNRLQSAYDGLGQSSGRPYLYFVYPPTDELALRRLIDQELMAIPGLTLLRIDVLLLTIDVLRGEEEPRENLLKHPLDGTQAAADIAGIWTRALRRRMLKTLAAVTSDMRPVIYLEGLAALHPLTNPTTVMESFAEHSIDHPQTLRPVPIVLFVPGVQLPHMSRMYQYLDAKSPILSMYRGEDI